MEKKINIAELLKDCPKGMELDCTLIEGLEFDCIVDNKYLPIRCRIKNPNGGYNVYAFTKYGCWLDATYAKCVIFPKGKTTWEGFQRPFNNGDIIKTITNNEYLFYSIYKGIEDKNVLTYIDYVPDENKIISIGGVLCLTDEITEQRFATEEEEQQLFDAIKANGYKWNAETKTLEKLIEPRFKVGDRIKAICNNNQYDIKELTDTHYTLVEVEYKFKYTEPISEDKNWELVPNKFDVTTLKPFDKVLVRNSDKGRWAGQFYTFYDFMREYPFECVYNCWKYCIPYEKNEHLLGTANDCDEYYKNWE